MKIFTALIIAIFLLTGCTSQKNNESSISDNATLEKIVTDLSDNSVEKLKVEPTTPEGELADWESAYRKKLGTLMNHKDYLDQSLAFSLYDISGDDIPELIVSKGVHRDGCEIYTFDGKVIDLGRYGVHSSIEYHPDTNILLENNTVSGIISITYYQTDTINSEGSLSELETLFNSAIMKEEAEYKINDEPVTEEEYRSVTDKYKSKNIRRLGLDFELNEKTLDAVFNDRTDWRECYKDLLYGTNESSEHCYFSTYDISGDGIPELFISTDSAHASTSSVYTFNDKLVYIGDFGSWGEVAYFPEKNILASGYSSCGSTSIRYYRPEKNGTLSEVAYLEDYVNMDQETVYKIDDVEVTEEEYNETRNKYTDDATIRLGRWLKASETFIEETFNESSDWKECYKKILAESYDSENDMRFSLYDITDDGIPELFVSPGLSRFESLDVYSFNNGLISFGTSLGAYGKLAYSPSQELFFRYDIDQGHERYIYNKLNKYNCFQYEINLYNTGADPSEEEISYKINNEEVSYEEYQSTLDKYKEIDDFIWLGRDYEFTESDILKAFS